MKNPEQLKPEGQIKKISIPENIELKVPYHEVKKVVQSLTLEEYVPFEFNNQTHQLIFCEEEHGYPIEFHDSTELDGCDIYIWQSVKEKGDDFLRTALAHELAEIAIYDILLEENKGDRQATQKQSHDIALLYEKQFVSENIGDERRKEYEIFSQDLRQPTKQE